MGLNLTTQNQSEDDYVNESIQQDLDYYSNPYDTAAYQGYNNPALDTERTDSESNSTLASGLHEAARRGASPDELDALVALGWEVDAVDEHGVTPLHVAAFFGREVTSKWLLERGRAAWMKDLEGLTPAEYARHQRHFDLARYIERRVAEVDPKEQERKREQQVEREVRAAEVDKLRATIEALKASEKRARAELERETRDKVRLLARLASVPPSSFSQLGVRVEGNGVSVDADLDRADLELKIVATKTARDVLAAELKLVEVALAALEGALFGSITEEINGTHGNTNGVASTPRPPKQKPNGGNDSNEFAAEGASLYSRLMRCAREAERLTRKN